jgi:hypothetical protein
MAKVTLEDIKAIKPGATEAFNCESDAMYAVATALSTLKRRPKSMPEGIIAYEHKKFFDKEIIIIRALREGDEPVLNK